MEVGERYIIEISDVITTNNGNIAKIKGFNALVFDENGLEKLEKAESYYNPDEVNEERKISYENGKSVGYSEGYDKGFKDGVKHQGNMMPPKAETEKSDACAEAQLSGRAMGHDEGYKEGYDEGKADALKGLENVEEPEDHEPQEGDVYKSIKSDDKILITYNDCGIYTIIDSDGNSNYYDAVELEKYYEYFGHRADLIDTLKGALV